MKKRVKRTRVLFVVPDVLQKERSGGSSRISQNIEMVRQCAYVEVFVIAQGQKRQGAIKWFLKNLVTIKRMARDADAVVMESPKYVMYSLFMRSQIIYSAHNMETLLRWQMLKSKPGLYTISQFLIFSFTELVMIWRASLIVTISQRLKQQLSALTFRRIVDILPVPGNEINFDYQGDINNPVYVFLGSFEWQPNRDAYTYFINSIIPELSKKKKKRLVLFVGNTNETIGSKQYGEVVVEGRGYVSDLNKLYATTYAVIAPITTGSGVKMKVIDAIARGLPIVMTQKAAEGLESYSEQLQPASNAAQFAAAIERLDSSDEWGKCQERINAAREKMSATESPKWCQLLTNI
jgi:hypothetical protein